MKWLDRYHDEWRTADYPVDLGVDEFGSYVDLMQNGFVERSSFVTSNKLAPPASTEKVSTVSTKISLNLKRNNIIRFIYVGTQYFTDDTGETSTWRQN